MKKNQNITQELWSSDFQNFGISLCLEIYANVFRSKMHKRQKKQDARLPRRYFLRSNFVKFAF